ncbi:MAG TPA: helix-turn-helix domain-containing protein, partial [Labilithrix sp.]|nr:helix-turn-helix domain-containing protein [Labilithrix sp.]
RAASVTVTGSAPNAFTLGVADVARRVHMSARTLQRRLQNEGTSWGEIVDDLRRTRARELASAGASDKEIAMLLGFSDPSALARARRRWSRASGHSSVGSTSSST